MISIVTAYYNRKKLFIRTLNGLLPYKDKIDFEFIVVDDGSDEDERLEDLLDDYPFLSVIRLEKKNKWYRNPCIPFNIGFEHINGDKVIIQNPECYHFDGVLQYVNDNLKNNEYLSFGCFSLDKPNTDEDSLFFDRENIEKLMSQNNHVVQIDGGLGWYNHSKYRRAALHFCSAITIEDLVDLGGFDPRYAWGHGFDDDEFIFRIRKKNMKVKFVDNIRVLHQNHYVAPLLQEVKYDNPYADRNKFIYNFITKNSNNYRANYLQTKRIKPKAGRSLSSLLMLSYMGIKQRLKF